MVSRGPKSPLRAHQLHASAGATMDFLERAADSSQIGLRAGGADPAQKWPRGDVEVVLPLVAAGLDAAGGDNDVLGHLAGVVRQGRISCNDSVRNQRLSRAPWN